MTTIGVHSGTFHVDDSLSCFLLKQLPEYKDAKVIRTRDTEVLKNLTIVVDVGGEYDHSKRRYDHHQRDYAEKWKETSKVIHCGCGLVYRHYGKRVIQQLIQDKLDLIKDETKRSEFLDKTYRKVYKFFIESIDGNDNGISQFDCDLSPKYLDHTSLSSRIKRLNPGWSEDESLVDERFEKASQLAGAEFLEAVHHISTFEVPMKNVVLEAIEENLKKDPKKEILELPRFLPLNNVLLKFEKKLNIEGQFKFIIWKRDPDNTWQVKAVRKSLEGYGDRVDIVKEWRGLRNEELGKISGIPDAVFVHSSGFLGVCETKEGAMKMANESIKRDKEEQEKREKEEQENQNQNQKEEQNLD
ncbi:metal dependent hydrolase - related [Anaeramoeba ignava]|uniref:Metal dependent hydrolase - related n=1 Tax=Anaeramoeba ignava TaxID=1746090 RepID=A0A9Q0LG10_ANAIG|nr:metal dependent hydrolase - related [Anaeramoeba ignava]